MQTNIFHTVNAGLYLWNGTHGLLIDGVHDGYEEGFSLMPEFLYKNLQHHTGLFGHIDSVLFTHFHPDHFQPAGYRWLTEIPDPPAVYGPGLLRRCSQIRCIAPSVFYIEMPGYQIYAKDTLHECEKFRDVRHQSFLIQSESEKIFVAGDAVLTLEDALEFQKACPGKITAAFFNLYQLASEEGYQFIKQMQPERVFLYHLPFKEDDRFNYRKLARQIVKNTPPQVQKAEILTHMSWIDGKPASWESETSEILKGGNINGLY